MPLMTRLPRILLNAVTVVSLILCVMTAVNWLTTLQADPLALAVPQATVGRVGVHGANGQIQVGWVADGPWVTSWVFPVPNNLTLTPAETCQWHAAGFGFDASGQFGQQYRIVAPHWFVILLTGALPLLWLVRQHQAHHAARGRLCPACGYDLRATPDHCPECGTAPPAGRRAVECPG
jgi:hypothetical protein